MIAIVCVWTLSFFLSILFECGTNYSFLWSTLDNLLTHCVNDTIIFKAFSISDVLTDGLILSLPLYWVWRVHSFCLTSDANLCLDMELAYVSNKEIRCIWGLPFGNTVSEINGIHVVADAHK